MIKTTLKSILLTSLFRAIGHNFHPLTRISTSSGIQKNLRASLRKQKSTLKRALKEGKCFLPSCHPTTNNFFALKFNLLSRTCLLILLLSLTYIYLLLLSSHKTLKTKYHKTHTQTSFQSSVCVS